MSEMRRFLRYEIPRLVIFFEGALLVFSFLDPNLYLPWGIILGNLTNLAALAVISSLLIGWLGHQLFEDLEKPHTKTRSFEEVRDACQEKYNLNDSQCLALIDYALKDDMYHHYAGLGDTFGGYWDHYYSRCVMGLGSTLILLIFIILCLYKDVPVSIHEDVIACVFFIYEIIIICILLGAKRIKTEIEAQEYLYIHHKILMMKQYARMLDPL